MVKLTAFLSNAQIDQAVDLGTADAIRRRIIEPNIGQINARLGEEHDPRYLAYAVETAIAFARKMVDPLMAPVLGARTH
jgi:hypothetical protein